MLLRFENSDGAESKGVCGRRDKTKRRHDYDSLTLTHGVRPSLAQHVEIGHVGESQLCEFNPSTSDGPNAKSLRVRDS